MISRELDLCDLASDMRQLRKQAESVSLRETPLSHEAIAEISSAIALLASELALLRKEINELREMAGK